MRAPRKVARFVRAAGGVLLTLALAPVAAAPTLVVAVLPFRNLAGGPGDVGEGIRETVTNDLREVGGLRVVERAALDKVLGEQNLQGQRADLDVGQAVRVGKLVGAELMVAGAYQRAGGTVRLTARFVRVETGEIVGSAKVDGPERTILTLQDKVTGELLRSAKIAAPEVKKITKRARPKLASLEPIALYGRASIEADGEAKRALLKEIVASEPDFAYALRDLDALEKRMRAYAGAAVQAQVAANTDLAKQIAASAGTPGSQSAQLQLLGNLVAQRRWRQLQREAKNVLAHPPKGPPPAPGFDLAAQARYFLLESHDQLKEEDAMLKEGEAFLRQHPASPMFSVVRMKMDAVIERKRRRDEGRGAATREIALLPAVEQADPCKTANVFQSHAQTAELVRALDACIVRGGYAQMPGIAEFRKVFAAWELGDYAAVRSTLERLRTAYPEQYRNARHLESMLPVE